jgi:hypothetical protein
MGIYMRRTGVESIYFDLITSIPFTWAEFGLYLTECVNNESPQPSPWSLFVQYVRIRVRACVHTHVAYVCIHTYIHIHITKCVNTESPSLLPGDSLSLPPPHNNCAKP